MDVSCIDESTTSSAAAAAASSPPKYPPDQSGGSAVTDAENGVEATSKKLPSSRFKGVVPQPNGRWGAQIYEKHQRVWLGTFNEEEQAARAYDTAVYRFRGRDGVANLKQESHIEKSSSDQIEYNFLNSRSKAEIVDMLRKHTYDDELEQYKRNQSINNNNNNCFTTNNKFVVTDCRHVSSLEQLFEKTVTPSDVGKLNRLVIPKQHAEKHFPLNATTTTTTNNNTNNATSSKGMLLNFDDVGSGKVWRFRYSYWNSSQSYVLTKGWSRFVKEKNLKAGDVVSFQRSSDNNNNQLYIDCKTRIVVAEPVVVRNVVRLFGVNICEAASRGGGDAVVEGGGKRLMRELAGFRKKQRVMIDDAL